MDVTPDTIAGSSLLVYANARPIPQVIAAAGALPFVSICEALRGAEYVMAPAAARELARALVRAADMIDGGETEVVTRTSSIPMSGRYPPRAP